MWVKLVNYINFGLRCDVIVDSVLLKRGNYESSST